MARKQSPILDVFDNSNYWFVVQWISRRFDEEERDPNKYVMSEPVGRALDAYEDSGKIHAQVRASWRELQKLWTDGWEKEYNNKLPDAEAYFTDLVSRTNAWLDEHLPATDKGVGRERQRLLAAVRQQRLRKKMKEGGSRGAMQVSISGDLYRALYRRWEIPASKHHDVARAALRITLESPELLAKAMQMAGVSL